MAYNTNKSYRKDYKCHVYLDKQTGRLHNATDIGRGKNAPKNHPERYASIGHWYGFDKFKITVEDKAYVVRKKNGKEIIATVSLTDEELAFLVKEKLKPSYIKLDFSGVNRSTAKDILKLYNQNW